MAETNQRLGDRLEQMDKEISAWAKATRQKLLFRLASLGLKDRVKLAKGFSKIRIQKGGVAKEEFLYKSLKARLRKKGGDLEGVSFTFARHGIFLERGVGKHRPKGSTAANNAARPWLFPIIDNEIAELADLLEQEYADIAAGELKINIPGIYETSIKIG